MTRNKLSEAELLRTTPTAAIKGSESLCESKRVVRSTRRKSRRAITASLALTTAMTGAVLAMTGPDGTGEPIVPVPSQTVVDDRKVQLGRRLFTDSRLSSGNGVSCASCHIIERGLADGLTISKGLPGQPGLTNTPSLFNVALNAKFNWSGHYFTLEEQAAMVIENERTMGGKWDEILSTLRGDAGLAAVFNEIYPDGVTRESIVNAIVEFEKSLITPNAPFDRYLKGDQNAISQDAAAGYQLFKDYGCSSCHQGVNVGGNMLQVFGIFGTPDAAARGSDTPGSARGSGIADDKPVFRVPPLRNVEMTAPYFHDGSARTLKDAIDVMAGYQLGRQISTEDVAKIESFLNSLTGEYQGVSIGQR